jgi:plasmid maintenance system antidote protein VapI
MGIPAMGTSGEFHVPTIETRAKVAGWYAAGVPQSRIAHHLDIDEKTLRKYYREQLDLCKDNMRDVIAKNLYQDALNGDKQAREFWLKCQAQWSYARPQEEVDKDAQTKTLMEKLIDKL